MASLQPDPTTLIGLVVVLWPLPQGVGEWAFHKIRVVGRKGE